MTEIKLDQSPNWNKRSKSQGEIDGFPFSEGLPRAAYDLDHTEVGEYDLILRFGERVLGRPFFSPFEGGGRSEWNIILEGKRQTFNAAVVAAWRKHINPEGNEYS